MHQTFGTSLKHWRNQRGLSQLALSMEADISSKHVSFLESGRSLPSREMVLHLGHVLEIPLAQQNVMLVQAGFSHAYSRMSFEDPKMAAVKHALEVMLNNHQPYPAMVFDWQWNIVLANETQKKLDALFKQHVPNFSTSHNIMERLFDPNGYRPFIKNWHQVASVMFARVKKEHSMFPDRQSNLLETLVAFGDIPTDWKENHFEMSEPMIGIDIEIGGVELSLFSTLAQFGTAADVTMQELIIEQYFPANESTKLFFESLDSSNEYRV